MSNGRSFHLAVTEEELSDLLWAMGVAFPWTYESKRSLIDKMEAAKNRLAESRPPTMPVTLLCTDDEGAVTEQQGTWRSLRTIEPTP